MSDTFYGSEGVAFFAVLKLGRCCIEECPICSTIVPISYVTTNKVVLTEQYSSKWYLLYLVVSKRNNHIFLLILVLQVQSQLLLPSICGYSGMAIGPRGSQPPCNLILSPDSSKCWGNREFLQTLIPVKQKIRKYLFDLQSFIVTMLTLLSLWPKHFTHLHELSVTWPLRWTQSSPSTLGSVSNLPSYMQKDMFFLQVCGFIRKNDNSSRFWVSWSKTATDWTAWSLRKHPFRLNCLKDSLRTALNKLLL